MGAVALILAVAASVEAASAAVVSAVAAASVVAAVPSGAAVPVDDYKMQLVVKVARCSCIGIICKLK